MKIFLIVTAVVVFLLLVPIGFSIEYKRNILLKIEILGIKIRVNKKNIKHKQDKEKEEKQQASRSVKKTKRKYSAEKIIKYIGENIKDIKKLGLYIAKRCIIIYDFRIKLDFGLSEADKTGIATGVLNGAVYMFLGILHHNTKLKEWDVSINPHFDTQRFDIEFLCIVRTRLLNIVSVGVRVLIIYLKMRKITKKKGE